MLISVDQLDVLCGQLRFDGLRQFQHLRFHLSGSIGADAPELSPKKMQHVAVGHLELRSNGRGEVGHAAEAGLMLVATDGHRLAKRLLRAGDSTAGMPAIIVPRKTIDILGKILPKEGAVTLKASDAKIVIEVAGTTLVSKLIDGTFPDYTADQT